MAVDTARAKSLFLNASDLSDPAERAAYLERECGGDAELRERVEALLRANDAAPLAPAGPREATVNSNPGAVHPEHTGEYTQHSGAAAPPRSSATTDYRPVFEPGLVIAGRYILAQKIGEGGMGEVWVAKQTEPVKRKVALKVIKTGMDSKAVLTRFEQERQALAMMDHPNIARVHDGGMTPTGQPFFVMELVNGLPLNKFCDEAKLTPKERLEIFVPICQAVQHAHQKGIVHRDLKPANIVITMIDGKPVPKVIDFGVAKATSGKLIDESMSTQFGAVVGTLEYMAPEQAGFSGEDIDTRADVYSLGVILYELLTGLRPIDAKRLQKAAVTEMIRIIREEEPSKPSTRLSTNDALPSLAALRQTEPRRLMTILRGELDWVVMKCLEKQRERRYETANALARDIQRYLADEAVEARPPSARYRMGKFVRRHKGQVIAASLVLFALLAGLVAVVVVQALANEKIQTQNDDLVRANEAIKNEIALKEEQRQIAKARLSQSLEALGLFATDFRMFSEDALLPGRNKTKLYERLIAQLERQVADDSADEPLEAADDAYRNRVWMYQTMAIVYLDTQQYAKAEPIVKKALKDTEAWLKLKPNDPYVLSFRAAHLSLAGDVQRNEAERMAFYQEALKLRRQLANKPEVDRFTPGRSLMQLADTLDKLREFEESLKLREQVCDVQLAKEADADKLFESFDFWAWTCWKAYLDVRDEARKTALLEKADELSHRVLKFRPGARRTLERWSGISRELGDQAYNRAKAAEAMKDFAEAKRHGDLAQKYYAQLADCARQLAVAPDLMFALSNYGRSFYALGLMESNLGKHAEARANFEKSRAVREQLLRDYAKTEFVPMLQIDLLFSRVALGEHAESVRAADAMQKAGWFNGPGRSGTLYRLACIYSLSAAAVEEVRRPNPLTDADKKLQADYRDKALTALEQSHALGNPDFQGTRLDADFIAIRNDPRFEKVLELEKKQKKW